MTNTTNQSSNENSAMTQVSPETVKLSEYMKSDQPMNTGMGSTDSVKPKKKMSFKLIIGAFVLLLVILGAAAGFYLTQFGQDLRQQAYVGQSCTYSSGCSNTGEICVKADGSDCNGASGCTCQVPTTPAVCSTMDVEPFQSCDPNPSTPTNECTGTQRTVSCTWNYTKWICGNKNWIPNYGAPNNGEGCSNCPWPVAPGQACCPQGVDACNPNTDNYKCVADPFVAECKPWTNPACPASQQGYWKAIEWCNTPGCECGPNGLFSDYSGPGCDCGGGGISCNDRCNTNSECTAANPAWSCVTAEDGLKRCRLTTNPTSPTCGGGGGGLNCNDSCTVGGTQCQAVNPAWFCDPASSKCRLQSNPSNTSCQPGTTTYQCNSDCTTTAQCAAVNSAWSCVSGKCRLTTNPSSTTCQPATTYQCNSDCTTTAQCQGSLGSAYSCVTNKCRLTANPTSATCEPATVGPMCKDVAILSQDGTELDPKQSGSFYVGQIIKFRCAADDPTNSLISKYQFRITEPGGAVIEGTAINPAGSSAVSKDYQINLTGSFKAQCRICLTDNTCQPYINIGAN